MGLDFPAAFMPGDFILDARHCEILPWMLDICVPKHILELVSGTLLSYLEPI